jgi:hypothetical protein
MTPTRALVPAAVAMTAILLGSAAPALAKDGDTVHSGRCSSGATWKVKAGPEDGRIEVEAEVDSNHAGQRWHWALSHNGSRSASGHRVTRGASGSFEVRRVMVDRRGTDTIVFGAKLTGTSRVCRGVIRF